uniref:Uncharacterized protein n=1 Tax=viral metagenome TaxID=1070528 RepID=A0A6M3IMK2_9ZZZZ
MENIKIGKKEAQCLLQRWKNNDPWLTLNERVFCIEEVVRELEEEHRPKKEKI